VEDRLGQMVEYAESARCRHMVILRYFGEQPAEHCESCDNCLGTGRTITAEPIAELSELLSSLRDSLAERYRKEAYEILDPRTVRELATYRPHDNAALLETWGIGDVKVGWFGAEVLAVIREWEDANPDADERPERPARAVRRKPTFTDAGEAPVDDAVYEQLVTWRRARALRDSVPAYVVFSNKTLREIAARCPKDERALSEVWGVGQSRVARYGTEVLVVVAGSD
jgi:ATP-dependent DNA helicase RecQ